MAVVTAVFLLCGFALGTVGSRMVSYGGKAQTQESSSGGQKMAEDGSQSSDAGQDRNTGISMEIAYGYDNTAKGGDRKSVV